jgi:hypothetical protein
MVVIREFTIVPPEQLDSDADYGALSYDRASSSPISPTLVNVNLSGCYSCVEGSSISLSSGSVGCGNYRLISVNGAYSITSIDLYDSGTTVIEYSTFFDDYDGYGTIYANSGLISLSHCYFKNNRPDLGSTGSAKFCAFCCFFSSSLPSVAWSTQSDNSMNYSGTVLPICHLDTAVCARLRPCLSDSFATSGSFRTTDAISRLAAMRDGIHFPIPRAPFAGMDR